MRRANPQEQSEVQGFRATKGEEVPLLGGHLVEAVWPPTQAKAPVEPGEQPRSLVLEQGRWG